MSDAPTLNSGVKAMQPGPGRTPGALNKRTVQQKEFASLVTGLDGSEVLAAFAKNIREQIMSGICPPAVTSLVMFFRWGKPVERLEIDAHVTPHANASREDLMQRLEVLRAAAAALPVQPAALRAHVDGELVAKCNDDPGSVE
jgi:hypothetical protein